MRRYTADNLVIHPGCSADPRVIVEVHPERAGWETLSFQVLRLGPGDAWELDTQDRELALVLLGGQLEVTSSLGAWAMDGGRAHVFAGLPHALYLPRRTTAGVSPKPACEIALASVHTDRDFAPREIRPNDIGVEIRGGDHATRQINNIIPPGFPCDRLVVVEVYTPGGNWSSYPPHKHDREKVDQDGKLVEADLDEIYYYRFDRPEGYALQRIYTGADSPLASSGHPIDATLAAHENDVVLVPEGYHPVSSPVGFTSYYLNALAGSAQSLASSDDPQYTWIKDSYRARDPRVPIYDVTEATKR